MALVILSLAVVVLIVLRVPIAVAFLLPSLGYTILTPGLDIGTVLSRVVSGIDGFVLLAVPLFILAGNMMNASGITDRIFDFIEGVFGQVRGSLGYANIGASIVFSGMSGSAVADAAGLGSVEIKAMKARGYDVPFAVGLTAASSAIGPIIPPSIIAIVYGVTAGVSIGSLFVAGVVPGLVMAAALAVMTFFYARKRNYPRIGRPSWGKLIRLSLRASLPMLTPIIILGGIVVGAFTPTEAAAVAVLYAAALGLIYRAASLGSVYRNLVGSAATTASVLFIVGSATLFSWILTREQAPQAMYSVIADVTLGNLFLFLLMINITLLVMGMVLEPIPVMLIMIPILSPAINDFGIDPIHFGIIMLVNLTIGMMTPPVGNVLYALSSAARVPFNDVVKGVLPFLVPLVVALLLITYIPTISLYLPRLLDML